MAHQKVGVIEHGGTVLALAVQKNHRVAVPARQTKIPSAQRCAVAGLDCHFVHRRVIPAAYFARPRLIFRPQPLPMRMDFAFVPRDADGRAQAQPRGQAAAAP
jgi:hypothetical protein